MDNNEFLEIFGEIVKGSRDSGLNMVSKFKNGIEIPKLPDEEEQSLISLVKSLDDAQIKDLNNAVKYCIELSLFKLISVLEGGVSKYSFDLTIRDHDHEFSLINKEVDNELIFEYFNWVGTLQ